MIKDIYEISKLRIVLYMYNFNHGVDGFYGYNTFVNQIFELGDGTLTDIFKDKYIDGLYTDGNMPDFSFNNGNIIDRRLFTNEELEKGLVTWERLLQIYQKLNSKYFSLDDIEYDNIVNARFIFRRGRKL